MTVSKEKLSTALNLLKNKVGSTMGRWGYNVTIEEQKSAPMRVTKDGATVAESMWSEDCTVDKFIRNIAQVAKSVEDEVGDGTTTATVMSTTLLQSLNKVVESGIHPRLLIRQMDAIFDELIKLSLEESLSCTIDEVRDVIKVSTNHDEAMTDIIHNIVSEIGMYGRFRVTSGSGTEDAVTIAKGYTIDTAVVSESLINSMDGIRKASGKIVVVPLELDAATLSGIIKNNKFGETDDSIFILCHRLADQDAAEIITTLNSINGSVSGVYPIRVSATPSIRNSQIEDIVGLTGFECEVTMERFRTTFHFDETDDRAKAHIEAIEARKSSVDSGYDMELLKERIQRIRGGFANVMVSGSTPTESKERRDRLYDALLASQSALREGRTIGGGHHYLNLLNIMDSVPSHLEDVMDNYLTAVYRRIHHNAGVSNSEIEAMLAEWSIDMLIENLTLSPNNVCIPVEDFDIFDSAGTPVRVFEASRALMHTLLPINEHVDYNATSIM